MPGNWKGSNPAANVKANMARQRDALHTHASKQTRDEVKRINESVKKPK